MFKIKPFTIDGLKFKAMDYHRNGISGTGFYVAIVNDPKENKCDFLVTYFPIQDEIACAVYALDILPEIAFGRNSWRGDHYSGTMEKAIIKFRKQYNKYLNAPSE